MAALEIQVEMRCVRFIGHIWVFNSNGIYGVMGRTHSGEPMEIRHFAVNGLKVRVVILLHPNGIYSRKESILENKEKGVLRCGITNGQRELHNASARG